MAKKRKAAVKKNYVLLYSDCGGVNQLEHLSGTSSYATEAAAKAQLKKMTEDGDLDASGTIVLAQVIDVGRTTGMEWAGKNTLY